MRTLSWAFIVPVALFIVYLGAATATVAARGYGQAPSAGEGQQVFDKRCSGCHSINKAKEGPPLAGVVGRKAASVPGFGYSDALKAASANITWDKATIDRWLTDPEKMVPDTDMSFKLANAQERAAVVEYLSTLK